MKCYVLGISLFLPLLGSAQSVVDRKQQDLLGKGRLNMGISVGTGYRGHDATTKFASPRIQYFVKNGWSIAAEGRFLKAGSDFTYLSAGLSTRYYVVRGKHFTLFAQAGATYGENRHERLYPEDLRSVNGTTNTNWQTNTGLGIHYRVGKRWSVEAITERSWLPTSNLTPDLSRWQVSAGLNYRIK